MLLDYEAGRQTRRGREVGRERSEDASAGILSNKWPGCSFPEERACIGIEFRKVRTAEWHRSRREYTTAAISLKRMKLHTVCEMFFPDQCSVQCGIFRDICRHIRPAVPEKATNDDI